MQAIAISRSARSTAGLCSFNGGCALFHEQTADEWGILLRNLFSPAGLDIATVDGMIISSVVPPIDSTLRFMAQRYFHTDPMFVSARTDLGIVIRYDNPNEVGADRLVNGVAGFQKYGGPCVVVDLGTTINFDVISRGGEYLGGAIAVGIGIAIEALFTKTARLPLVDFRPPKSVVGTNTVASMQSGLYYGAIGMIDGILERTIEVMGPDTKTVATGGQARHDRQRVPLLESTGRASHTRRIADDLGAEPRALINYFNYFTEIEEHFQRARGTGLFLLSPLDWALIESWKNAEVPLEAVMRGIDAAFEKWRSRKVKTPARQFAGILRARPY
jgi:type III pantothenate kinase